MKKLFLVFMLLLLLISGSVAFGDDDALRQAWQAFAKPILDPLNYNGPMMSHRAREEATGILLTVQKKDAAVYEALGYFYLRDYKYNSAKEQFETAIKHNGKEPRLRYLLAQTKAILLLSEPAKAADKCKDPMDEFLRASAREPGNALPYLQAASVAFDCERPDLAAPPVEAAMSIPALRLYQLDIPAKLSDNPEQNTAVWWWAQSEFWGEALNRTANSARGLMRIADRNAISGDSEKAISLYQQVYTIGDLLCHSSPALTMALSAGLEIERQALTGKLAVATKSNRPDANVMQAKLAKIKAAQNSLKLQKAGNQPKSIEELMQTQKALVDKILASL